MFFMVFHVFPSSCLGMMCVGVCEGLNVFILLEFCGSFWISRLLCLLNFGSLGYWFFNYFVLLFSLSHIHLSLDIRDGSVPGPLLDNKI